MEQWKDSLTETEMSDMCAQENVRKSVQALETEQERGTVLRETLKVINGARQDAYGNPENSFAVIGELMTVVSDMDSRMCYSMELLAALNLICLKFGRALSNPKDRDTWRDFAGYVALACDMAGAQDIVKE